MAAIANEVAVMNRIVRGSSRSMVSLVASTCRQEGRGGRKYSLACLNAGSDDSDVEESAGYGLDWVSAAVFWMSAATSSVGDDDLLRLIALSSTAADDRKRDLAFAPCFGAR